MKKNNKKKLCFNTKELSNYANRMFFEIEQGQTYNTSFPFTNLIEVQPNVFTFSGDISYCLN